MATSPSASLVPPGFASIDVAPEMVALVVGALAPERRMDVLYRNPALLVPLDLLPLVQVAVASADELLLEAQRASKRAAIEAERDRRLGAGVTFSGVAFQSDPTSRARIDKSRGSAMAALMGGAQPGDLRWHGLPVDFIWIAADNSRLPMDARTMVAFGNVVAAREGLLIVAANDLKLLVDAGEAIADVGDDTLWPV